MLSRSASQSVKKSRHLNQRPYSRSQNPNVYYGNSSTQTHLVDVQNKQPSGFGKLFSRLRTDDSEGAKQQQQEQKYNGTHYFFLRGNEEFLSTTDNAPQLVMDNAAEQVSQAATKFWAELFGSVNVLVTFFIVFFLQLFR
jgi:hypothetical protein